MNIILTSCVVAAIIGGAITLINSILQRKWLQKDKNEDKNNEILTEISEIKTKFDDHIKDEAEWRKQMQFKDMKASRVRILKFNNEILQGINHTKEFYDEILDEIDEYELSCQKYDEFINNKAKYAIKNVKDSYRQKMAENTFSSY